MAGWRMDAWATVRSWICRAVVSVVSFCRLVSPHAYIVDRSTGRFAIAFRRLSRAGIRGKAANHDRNSADELAGLMARTAGYRG